MFVAQGRGQGRRQSVSRTARKLSVLPSRDDELVRRRIDVDGGRDPTDGTILRMASPWHSNVPSGKPYPPGTATPPYRYGFSFRFSLVLLLTTTGPIDPLFDHWTRNEIDRPGIRISLNFVELMVSMLFGSCTLINREIYDLLLN